MLICLTGFLLLPNISSAVDINDIDLREMGKHLELPAREVESLLHSLINLFYSEWINLMASGHSTDEERAVPIIMKKVVQVQALNHLLIDAPIQTTWIIVKNSVKIARFFLASDFSDILKELENESVKKAVGYGMSVLLEKEIKISPGAIDFEYISQKREKQIARLQYLVVYRPYNSKKGEALIRFYSPNPIEPPENKGSIGMFKGIYTDLSYDLPPFIVDIRGTLENYKWVGRPSINIDFPNEVPDLGIKPLSLWERFILKPIENTIKDVEIIITKITGKSLGLPGIWDKIKTFVSGITNLFSPAAIIPSSEKQEEKKDPPPSEKPGEVRPLQTEKPGEVRPLQTEKPGEVRPLQDENEEEVEPLQDEAEICRININTASKEELQKIIGIGPVLSQRIIDARPFSSIYYLINVSGIGEITLKKIIEQNCAFVDDSYVEEKEIFEEIEEETTAATTTDICPVNINTASKEDLQAITGIGPVLAQRIIDARPFSSIYNLTRVSGIGEITLQKIIIQDCAYVVGDTGQPTFFSGGGGTTVPSPSPDSSPQINLNYPEEISVNEEIEVELSVLDLENKTYDVKISIDTGSPFPYICYVNCEQEENWLSSVYYITEVFSGTSFQDNFRLKIKNQNFRGPADITARIRENGKDDYLLEFKGEINIIDPPEESEENNENIEDTEELFIVSFSFFPEDPTANQEIIFDASSSTGQIISYFWDFGEGTTTTLIQSTTSHAYLISGDFTVNLTVFGDNNATGSATTTVIVSAESISEEPTLEVVINEIAWMGTGANYTHEWIELYNNTATSIDLTGWTLNAVDSTPSIIFSTSTIQDYFLLERTDDSRVSNIPADLIYTGNLGNDGEKLELRNASGILIDVVDCSSGWFSGNNDTKQTMERINSTVSGTDPNNWASNNLITRNGLDAEGNKINGTPRAENSVSKSETEISGTVDYPTLTYLGNPYVVTSNLIVPFGHTLTIEPGVTLKFSIPQIYGPNDGACLKVYGNLVAIGQPQKEIIFTSTRELWPGIVFESSEPETAIGSQLEYVKVEKARSWESAIHSAIKVNQKAISIKNSVLEYMSNYRGLYLVNSSSTIDNVTFSGFTGSSHQHTGEYPSAVFISGGAPRILNSNFSDNYYGISVETNETCLTRPDFKISQNTFVQNYIPILLRSQGFPCFSQNQVSGAGKDMYDNVFDGIYIGGVFNLHQDTVWQADLPVILGDRTRVIAGNLTIKAGMKIKFKYGPWADSRGRLRITGGGELITEGNENDYVIFTSAKENPAAGNWMSIWFEEGSFGDLNYTKIKYGGFGSGIFRNQCLVIESDNVSQSEVEKEFCSPY